MNDMARESKANKQERVREIIARLREHYPAAKCSLDFRSVHQLMVATILSAQCTDERVNEVTKTLFKKYRSIKDFAAADIRELEEDIKPTGFFRNKAKSIKLSAQQLLEEYGGEIPQTLDQLTKLAGVGRKTGSVILGVGFGLAEGIVVDTHVGRISRLLGLTKETDPVKVERDLMKLVPKEDWIDWSHLLIYHGRALCIARRPKCGECFLAQVCPSFLP
ncbi:MAG TPA: endonuclease III [candidate division Zixibacteria bacterium]|nr:endonuclease III [candidate division Zixibacteria bacterium]